ncbi:hypothetical protein KKE99_05495 [Patescibacteria group bacterium]|nr:hypothetical protein [Patescibacteria group bacterium]
MNEKEILLNIIKDREDLEETMWRDYIWGMDENIKQQRSLIKHFILISSGIIGFTIPMFGRTNLIKNPVFLIGGLVLLLIVVLYGFFYLTRILKNENEGLEKVHKEFLDLLDFSENSHRKFLSDSTDENFKKLQEKSLEAIEKSKSFLGKEEKTGNPLDLIFSSFFLWSDSDNIVFI